MPHRVNSYVRNVSEDLDASAALSDFRRFPRWTWRNAEVVGFVEWLRAYNDARPPGMKKAGFYGLDLYSLHASMAAVLDYLDRVDPDAAQRARARYACFNQFGPDPQVYGFIAATDLDRSCRDEVVSQLVETRRRVAGQPDSAGPISEDELFYAEQNARLVKDAEAYYRSMFFEEVSSWNLRDTHMAETLDALAAHLGGPDSPAKVVLWAHNSHLGDARATDMGERGDVNVGQLVRAQYGRDAVLVGFTTHHGTVTAASDWGGPTERKRVRPALEGSWEALFHSTSLPGRFLLDWHADETLSGALREARLERAIGVIYRPATERASHYFKARLGDQFDAVLHFDETEALEPFDSGGEWQAGELPETFPSAV